MIPANDAATHANLTVPAKSSEVLFFVYLSSKYFRDFFFSLHFQDRHKEEKHRDCLKRPIVLSRDMSVLN